MELHEEWRKRIEKWIRVLAGDVYRPVLPITFEGFETDRAISYGEALQGEFGPVRKGDSWGADRHYMWLKSRIKIPDEAKGSRVVMSLNPGAEASVWVDGLPFGCRRSYGVRNRLHVLSDLTLTKNAEPGTDFFLVVEAYAGHHYTGCAYGPVIPGSYQPPDLAAARTALGDSSIGIWNEDAYQLYIDVKVLFDATEVISQESLRYWDIWEALKRFTATVDFELPKEERDASYRRARRELKPLFEAKNGTVCPKLYAFGHGHIDICWLWPYEESERKVLRTFAAQIRHMEEYPEYKFLQSQPHLYEMTKNLYPELYAQILEKAKSGQWIPEGATYVENDTNITGEESLVRQFLYGKRFFKEEFGVDSKLLWLPDSFGYSAALPQVMKGCGVDCFSTQKIWWTYNGGETFPYNYFYWQGIDGSKVTAFLHEEYNSDVSPATLVHRWKDRKQKPNVRGFLVPYGYGDGGGGPSRDYMEMIRREADFQGVPKIHHAHPLDFFKDMPKPEDTYVGELYLQIHRGVLTSQARTKRGNRKCEFALQAVEFLGVLAGRKGISYPLEQVRTLWRRILLCQFHDILPGTSIKQVYEMTGKTYAEVLDSCGRLCSEMAAALTDKSEALTVFNPLGFERTAIVTLPAGFSGAKAKGVDLPVQKLGDDLLCLVNVPACGTVCVTPGVMAEPETRADVTVGKSGAILENPYLKVTFNQKGAITSVLDKTTGSELLRGISNDFRMYKDIPVEFEAWDVDTSADCMPVPLTENAAFEVVSQGPVKAILKITRQLNHSRLEQEVSLTNVGRRVDFDTTIDWQELHKMLKVTFDVDYTAEEALHEIQFGHVRRPNHRSRPIDFDRFEVVNQKWTALCEEGRGFAVLNDCKYGVSTLGTRINLTLLRAPFSPDPTCDRGIQHFVYSFYAWNGSFLESDLVREGYDLNQPVMVFSGIMKDGSLLEPDAKNIVTEAIKPAEDGSGDIILRLYESARTRTKATLTLHFSASEVSQVNMLETDGEKLPTRLSRGMTIVPLTFHPFEIKTLRIKE